MKRGIYIIIVMLSITPRLLYGQVHVHGYIKKDGTHVQPHYRSNLDGNPNNNWSTKGNINPYTGESGTRNPKTPSTSTSSYTGGISQPISPSPESNTNTAFNSGYQNQPVYGSSYSTIIPIDLSGGVRPMPDLHLPSAPDNTDYTPHYVDEALPSLSSIPHRPTVHRKSVSKIRVHHKAALRVK